MAAIWSGEVRAAGAGSAAARAATPVRLGPPDAAHPAMMVLADF